MPGSGRRTGPRSGGVRESWIEIRQSRISGLGAFARSAIPKGIHIIEYRGKGVSPEEADRRYADGPATHPHMLLFSLEPQTVIDPGVGGKPARFINHSSAPIVRLARATGVWSDALRDIKAGGELTYDYNLSGESERPDEQWRHCPCRCGARNCRGTIFNPA